MKSKQLTNKNPLQLVKLLIKNSCTKEEIQEKLNIKPSTFFKNLKLLIRAGFKFAKENEKYSIVSFCNTLEYTPVNISTMAHLMTLSSNIFPKYKTKRLLIIFKKFLYLSNQKDYDKFIRRNSLFRFIASNTEYIKKIERFEKYVKQKANLHVVTNELIEYSLLPVEYKWEDDKVIFVFENLYQDKEIMQIPIDKITKMTPEKEDVASVFEKRATIFELSGRLARTYLLRDNEILTEHAKEKITVSNSIQDKQKLFKRLLRYDVLCEVKFPKRDRNAFLDIIKKSLDNID